MDGGVINLCNVQGFHGVNLLLLIASWGEGEGDSGGPRQDNSNVNGIACRLGSAGRTVLRHRRAENDRKQHEKKDKKD